MLGGWDSLGGELQALWVEDYQSLQAAWAPGWTSHVSNGSNSWLGLFNQVMPNQWLPGAGWKAQY